MKIQQQEKNFYSEELLNIMYNSKPLKAVIEKPIKVYNIIPTPIKQKDILREDLINFSFNSALIKENNLNKIENLITEIKGLKGIERKNQIEKISLSILKYCYENKKPYLTKDFINSFFEDIKTNGSNRILIKAIKDFLISSNKIKKVSIEKITPQFRVNELKTNDCESYTYLMVYNGYYKNFYYFEGIKKIYLKKYVAFNMEDNEVISSLNLPLLENGESLNPINIYVEQKSFLKHNAEKNSNTSQKCESITNLSIKKHIKGQIHNIQVYELI